MKKRVSQTVSTFWIPHQKTSSQNIYHPASQANCRLRICLSCINGVFSHPISYLQVPSVARHHLHGCQKLIPWRGMRVERFAVNSCFSQRRQRERQSQKTNKRCGCLQIRHYVPCTASAQPQEYKIEWGKKILPFQADVGYVAAKNAWIVGLK